MLLGFNVDKQQEIAATLIAALKPIDPFVMIAGGAPRDWYFNKLANDLDVYIRLPNHNTIGLVESLARLLGITNFHVMPKTTDTSYAELPNLKWVFEGYFQGMKVNLMIMDKGVREEIVKDFDVAICKAWFDGVESHYHEEFEFCVKTRVCVVHQNYTGKEAHVQRMAKRFPQFMFYKKLDLDDGEPDVSFDPPPAPMVPPMPSKRKKTLDEAWDNDNF